MAAMNRKRRGNSRYFVYFSVIVFVLIGFCAMVCYYLANSNWLQIKEIKVVGNKVIATYIIQAKLMSCMNKNILQVSSTEVKRKLYNISRIKDVKVKKRIPHTLLVELNESTGFLNLKSLEGDIFTIDENCKVLDSQSSNYIEDLPIIHTYIPNSIIKAGVKLNYRDLHKIVNQHKVVTKECPKLIPTISEYYVSNGNIIFIDAKTGTRVILGDSDLAAQIRRYHFVQENGGINPNSIIDLRFKDQVVVKAGN